MNPYIAKRHQVENGVAEMMKSADQATQYDDVIDLSLGDPDMNTDSRIIEATFEDVRKGYTHYAPAQGDPELIQAIQNEYKKSYQYDLKKEEIMITTSGCHAMWLVLETLLNPGDEVIVFAPFFTPYPEQIQLAQGKPVIVDTDLNHHFEIDFNALTQAITSKTKAIILNTPCNPTGACQSKKQLQQLADVAKKYDILVIADDIYTIYDYAHPFYPITACEGMKERTISIRSFSKDYCMSGWRIGYVLAPAEIISTMRTINESNVFAAPSVSQRAAIHALRLKDEIQSSIRKTYYDRAHYIYQRVQEIDYLDMPKPQGSLYTFLDIRKSGESSASFSQKLFEKYHISVIPGTAFGACGEGFVRIAHRVNEETLKVVFDALQQDKEWNKQQ